MAKKYSDLIITDDIFDENMEKLADENNFAYGQFLDFVQKLPENLKFNKQENKNGYEEFVCVRTLPNHSIDCASHIEQTIFAYEFGNGFMLFGDRDSFWD